MQCAAQLCFAISAWLTAHSYDPDHRDAVLRYIQAESGFEEQVVSRSGACLCQWAGSRRRSILSQGRCPSWERQLEFADAELRSGLYERFWKTKGAEVFRALRDTFGRGKR
jgi:hypothetical protein